MNERTKAFISLLLGCILHAYAIPVVKRATSEQNINDVFSRFTKRSNGWASYYGEYPTGTGACSLDPMPAVFKQKGWIKVAAGAPDFQKSLGCGMCLKIEASGKPVAKGDTPLKGTYYGVINDLCGACGQGDLDFYIPGDGKWDISFDAINCPDVSGSEGNIQYRFTGSNQWYLKLQITNSKQPTAAVEFFKGGKWHCAKRSDDNHFVWNGVGKIDFPLRTRLTSITGETVGGDITKLVNDKDQDSGFQYKPIKEVNKDGTPPKLPCHGQGGLVRSGKADDVTNQGQSSQGSGSSGSTTPRPTEKPEEETKTDKEVPGGEGEGKNPDKGGQNGNETKPGTGKEEEKIENIEDFCRTRPNGIYGDPTDCQYFIKCANSKTYRTKCANGLHWNDKIKNCDFPASAGCSDQKEKDQRGQQDTKNGTSNGENKEEADIIAVLRSTEEEDPKQEEAMCPPMDKETARHHHPLDCSKFVMCNGTMGKTFRCPEGYLYDRYRTKCREGKYVSCDRNSLHISGHEDEKQATANLLNNSDRSVKSSENLIDTSSNSRAEASNDESFCLGRADGFYKFKNDCSAFYNCSRGLTRLRSCPEGLLFNEADEMCDWPKHVHC